MIVRKWFAIFFSIMLFIPFFFVLPTSVSARNYAVQIKDPQDVKRDSDFKTISMKDDFDYLYIKLDSWKKWNLESSNCFIEIHILVNGTRNIDYIIAVFEEGNRFMGGVIELETEEVYDMIIDFDRNKSSGTIQIDKKLIKMKSSNLSFRCYASVLDDPGYYYDAAPDDQEMVDYVPGPNTEKPKVDVSTIFIQGGDVKKNETAQFSFEIMNKGEGTVEVLLTPSANIRLSTEKIKLGEYETSVVTVFASGNRLASQGYTESIEVLSNFGNYSITVNFYVLPEPKLMVDVESIDFGQVMLGDRVSEKITISNQQRGPISVTLSSRNKWIMINKKEFEAKSEEVLISVSTKSMEVGVNEGSLKIISNGGSAEIPVTIDVIRPVTIDQEEFDFGEINVDESKTASLPFILKNQTDEQISLNITCAEPWIAIASDINLKPKEEKALKVSLKLDKMETVNKEYQGEIVFKSKNDQFTIPVKAYLKQDPPKTTWVTDPPGQKEVQEKIITGKVFEKLFIIKNDGSGEMKVEAKLGDSKTDFRLFNAIFTLKRGESREIKVKLDSTGMKLGTYQNILHIESNGGNLTIPISVEIQPLPIVIIKLYIGLSMAYIDQKSITLDAPPYITKGTTMVPLRFISDAFRAKIEWLSIGKGRILLTVPSKSIQLDIGEAYAYINGEKLPLQAAPEIKAGRTFVPVRFIAEGLGAKIEWKADTQQITILYTIMELD